MIENLTPQQQYLLMIVSQLMVNEYDAGPKEVIAWFKHVKEEPPALAEIEYIQDVIYVLRTLKMIDENEVNANKSKRPQSRGRFQFGVMDLIGLKVR